MLQPLQDDTEPPSRWRARRPSAPTALLVLIAATLLLHVTLQLWQLVPSAPSATSSSATGLPTVAAFADVLGVPWPPPAAPLLGLLPASAAGQVFLYVPRRFVGADAARLLHSSVLAAGLGTGAVLLDRGRYIRRPTVVHFVRHSAGRVLLVADETLHVTSSPDPDQRAALKDTFASSTLAAFDVVAQDDGGVLLAVGDYLLDPWPTLPDFAQWPSYHLVPALGRLDLAACRAFPLNVELSAWHTYRGGPSAAVQAATGDATGFTVQLRYSFAALPATPLPQRQHVAQCGLYAQQFLDHGVPLSAPRVQSYVVRQRLERDLSQPVTGTDGQTRYRPLKPIVYYLDRSAPSPVREAVLAGARWWAAAFEAAGWADAFRVELLPVGADLLDVRYNVIEWTHRTTRSWSYGQPLVDPRTGEVLRGYVVLGSGRSRQDFLLAAAILGDEAAALNVTLARLRQLAAHEVGHTLGLQHNFAASVANRSSVMDYPGMDIRVVGDGTLDGSAAYAPGLGRWDYLAVEYGYAVHNNEAEGLAETLSRIQASGVPFLMDTDAGVDGAAPAACQWDAGSDPVAQLSVVLEARRAALARLARQSGRGSAAHVTQAYLWHRYQVACAAKVIGGLTFAYDGARATPIPFTVQQSALEAILASVAPAELHLPVALLQALPPGNPNFCNGPDLFGDPSEELPRPGGRDRFDPSVAAYVAAELVFGPLLHPDRAARLVAQERAGDAGLGFGLTALLQLCAAAAFGNWSAEYAVPAMAVQQAFVDAVAELHQRAPTPLVQAAVTLFIADLAAALKACETAAPTADVCGDSAAPLLAAHRSALQRSLARAGPNPFPVVVLQGPPI